jgi:glycosyltransferase involved in cell wall biosynthesis
LLYDENTYFLIMILNSSPLISVITIVYNGEKTLERAIQSVLSQDYPNIEYVLVDGGSQDSTPLVLQKYKDAFSVCISEPDRGIYDAMNKGILASTGEMIVFLNSDDVYANNHVISEIASLFATQNVDAIYADVEYFCPPLIDKVVRTYRSNRFDKKALSKGLIPAHPTLFIKRKIYEAHGLYDPSYKSAGDFELIARFFGGGSLSYYYYPKVLVRMQVGGASATRSTSLLRINREIMRACRQNNIPATYWYLLSRYPSKLMELTRNFFSALCESELIKA